MVEVKEVLDVKGEGIIPYWAYIACYDSLVDKVDNIYVMSDVLHYTSA